MEPLSAAGKQVQELHSSINDVSKKLVDAATFKGALYIACDRIRTYISLIASVLQEQDHRAVSDSSVCVLRAIHQEILKLTDMVPQFLARADKKMRLTSVEDQKLVEHLTAALIHLGEYWMLYLVSLSPGGKANLWSPITLQPAQTLLADHIATLSAAVDAFSKSAMSAEDSNHHLRILSSTPLFDLSHEEETMLLALTTDVLKLIGVPSALGTSHAALQQMQACLAARTHEGKQKLASSSWFPYGMKGGWTGLGRAPTGPGVAPWLDYTGMGLMEEGVQGAAKIIDTISEAFI